MCFALIAVNWLRRSTANASERFYDHDRQFCGSIAQLSSTEKGAEEGSEGKFEL